MKRAGQARLTRGRVAAAVIALLGGIASCAFNTHGEVEAGSTTASSTEGTASTSASAGSGGATTSGSATTTSSTAAGTGGATTSTSGTTSTTGTSGTGGTPFTLAQGDFELYYGESVSPTPLVRTWDKSTWSAADPTVASGASVKWVAAPAAIAKEEVTLVLSSTGGNTSLDLLRRTGATTWVTDWTSTAITVANVNARGFDVEQEWNSGDALAVFSNNTGTPQFRTRSGGAWSAATDLPGAPGSGTVLWVDLVSRHNSDEIALFYSDSSGRLVSAIWNGTAWGTPMTLETALNTTAYLNFGGAYESMSGDLLAFWGGPNVGGGAVGAYSATLAAGGTAWTISAELPVPFNRPGPVRMASEPGTDRIALAYLEFTCNGSTCDDFVTAIWNGSAWQDATRVDSYITVAYSAFAGAIPVDVGWVGTTGQAVAVYTATGAGIDWANWTSSAHWVLQGDATTNPPLAQRVNVRAVGGPGQSSVMFLISDAAGALYAKSYDGSAWSDVGASLESTLSSLPAGPFAVSIKR
jgi:hypothetical protein